MIGPINNIKTAKSTGFKLDNEYGCYPWRLGQYRREGWG